MSDLYMLRSKIGDLELYHLSPTLIPVPALDTASTLPLTVVI